MLRHSVHRPRGFTLIELMFAAMIMSMAVAAASLALLSQYRGLQGGDLSRLANGTDRAAIQSIEHSLRLLGWGVDPRYAIDLKNGCSATPCRDRNNASDDLAFVARDPLYKYDDATATFSADSHAWKVNSVTTGATPTVSVTLPTGYKLEKGRVIMLACAQGQSQVMLTLSATYTGTGSGMTLTPFPTTTVGAPYNDLAGVQTCHGSGVMFLVDRFHYFVQKLPTGCIGKACTPWLMLDTGLDLNGDGTLPVSLSTGAITDAADLIPVAKNVVDMQAAYVLNSSTGLTAPDTNGDWVLGNDASGGAEEPDYTATAPGYTTPNTDPSRYSKNPANVRAVRVSLLIRSDRVDQSHSANWVGDKVNYAENRSGQPPLQSTGYRAYTAETQIYTRNLESRLAFLY